MAQQPRDADEGLGGGADNLTVLLKSWLKATTQRSIG